MCSIMSTTNVISNKILIVLSILIRCSLTLPSTGNGTFAGLMFMSNDLQCLAQMPVGDLMKIQKAIRAMNAVSVHDAQRLSNAISSEINNQNQNQSDSRLREIPVAETRNVFQHFIPHITHSPQAEPFMMDEALGNKQLIHKTGYGSEWEEEKPSKVQKILHLSLTALSFLAFAGYLLCMIVQAIKSKGTTYFHTTGLPMVAIQSEKPLRLTGARPNRFRRNTRKSKPNVIAEPDPFNMFQLLLDISKGYVQLSDLSRPPT